MLRFRLDIVGNRDVIFFPIQVHAPSPRNPALYILFRVVHQDAICRWLPNLHFLSNVDLQVWISQRLLSDLCEGVSGHLERNGPGARVSDQTFTLPFVSLEPDTSSPPPHPYTHYASLSPISFTSPISFHPPVCCSLLLPAIRRQRPPNKAPHLHSCPQVPHFLPQVKWYQHWDSVVYLPA